MYTVDSNFVHTFAGNPLDRGQQIRKDDGELAKLSQADDSRFLLLHKLKVATNERGNLAWISPQELPESVHTQVFLGLQEGSGRFAASVPDPIDIPGIH